MLGNSVACLKAWWLSLTPNAGPNHMSTQHFFQHTELNRMNCFFFFTSYLLMTKTFLKDQKKCQSHPSYMRLQPIPIHNFAELHYLLQRDLIPSDLPCTPGIKSERAGSSVSWSQVSPEWTCSELSANWPATVYLIDGVWGLALEMTSLVALSWILVTCLLRPILLTANWHVTGSQ